MYALHIMHLSWDLARLCYALAHAAGQYGVWRGYNNLLYITIAVFGDTEQPYLQYGTNIPVLQVALTQNFSINPSPAYKFFPLISGAGGLTMLYR